MNTIGIIDIGSNSIKLLVVKINDDKSFESLFNKKFQIRLTDYMTSDKDELSTNGIKNFFGIISTFKILCNQFSCDEIIAVGTEALRNLKNSSYLIKDIYDSLQINIQILSPEEECYYGYLSSIPENMCNYVHLDIGGGSVEIGLVKNNKLTQCKSIPMGALNLTNQFNLNKNYSHQEKEATDYIIDQLQHISWSNECKSLPMIVIGGSIKTIGRIHKMEYDTSINIHGCILSKNDINSLLCKVQNLTIDEILSSTGVSKTRGDILLGALLLTNSIFEFFKCPSMIISKYTIRDGIIKEYIKNL